MGSKGGGSKPTYTAQQKKLLEWGESTIMPMAEGRESIITERLEQQATDITELQRKRATENIMDVAGTTGMGSSQIAGLLTQAEDTAIQQGFKNIMGAKMAMTERALGMISGVPLAPGQTTKAAKEGGLSIASKIGDLVGGTGGMGGGIGSIMTAAKGAQTGTPGEGK